MDRFTADMVEERFFSESPLQSRVSSRPKREEGTVKWFSAPKGYGFIAPDRGGKDLFVHHTAIQMEGYKTLSEDQRVTFEIVRGAKGPQADSVSVVL